MKHTKQSFNETVTSAIIVCEEISMRFEERDLPPCTEALSAADFEEGATYFSVHYVDSQLLIPTLEPIVFAGKNLEPGDIGQVYFQDINSFRRGVRYQSATKTDHAQFYSGPEDEMIHVFNYDKALDDLLRCSLRRKQAEKGLS